MNDKTMQAGRYDLPAVDEELAGALLAQGELSDLALGLLRNAHRVLSGAGGLERPGEIAEACVRSAADALLKLPGVPDTRMAAKSVAQVATTGTGRGGSPSG
ncbi:hypothetical protein AB0P17_42980 [Streptomyces sp. NPDC088124]|uniref:hypothetical protein n=1 Tax=Streptomyces sp. NPDC088124 TaxID=3154654 RepID=UPI003424BF42